MGLMPFASSLYGFHTLCMCTVCTVDTTIPLKVTEYHDVLTSVVEKIGKGRFPRDIAKYIAKFASKLSLENSELKNCLRELNAGELDQWYYIYTGTWNVPCNVGMKYKFKPSLILYEIQDELYLRHKTKKSVSFWRYEKCEEDDGQRLHIVSSQRFRQLSWGGRVTIFLNSHTIDEVAIESCRDSVHTIRVLGSV